MPTSDFARALDVTKGAEECWHMLTDVPRLVTWVGIVENAEELAPLARYTALLSDRIGPFRLRADLDIEVSDVEPARHIRVRASGEDRQVRSRIGVDATLRLTPRDGGGTRVEVAGTYEVTGRVATMGAGTIRKKADTILGEFFEHATHELGALS